MVKLDIVSDPICPWCYIGKTLLDRALEQRLDHPFVVEWHPYQLNPDMPHAGMDRRAYLESKFGGKAGAIAAYAPVVQRAETAGLTINFEAMKRTPNTLNAHRLIHWAGIEGKQNAAAMTLFDVYFTQGRDIGDAEVLADIADEIGMDATTINKLLASNADEADIRARDTQFREMGITSVPTFIVAAQHAVPGAQETAMWLSVMDEIIAKRAADGSD